VTAVAGVPDYYANADVRERITEYCGATSEHGPTCSFVSELAPPGHVTWAAATRQPADRLPDLLDRGWDISRSLSDRASLIVYFELEMSDPDDPGRALLQPVDAFEAMEPAYRVVCEELDRLELPLLDVMTGRGYHFAGRLPLTSAAVTHLAAIAPEGSPRADRAFHGLGMALEYLAQNVYQRASRGRLPVVPNGVEVGGEWGHRQSVSIDFSAYGDPLRERQMRVAFGTYQHHRVRPDIFGVRAARDVAPLAALPRRRRPLAWMLKHARTLDDAIVMAQGERARLPDVADGIENTVVEYTASPLCDIHRVFYAVQPQGPSEWPATYDRVAGHGLPPCIARALQAPNDALLKPTVLQQLTRFFMARGWAPPDVAGLVWSKYARDHGWGDRWTRLDPRRRAEFDVRVFASAVSAGVDEAVDFNCVSAQEKGLCPRSGCPHDLRVERAQLLERVAV
jgi:hypothetical protein